jgi:hypothetical protein
MIKLCNRTGIDTLEDLLQALTAREIFFAGIT